MADHKKPETSAYVLVIFSAQNITLPEILRHIEAGRIVILISAPNAPR